MGKAAEMLLPIEGIKVKNLNFQLVILNSNTEQIHAAKIIDFSPNVILPTNQRRSSCLPFAARVQLQIL